MLDIFNSDAFAATSLAASVKTIPYMPSRLGPKGLNLFDERPIATTMMAVEAVSGQLSLISDTPRGAPGDFIGEVKRKMIPFVARHLKRSAKIMADEVQNVRVYGSEDQVQSVEMKRDEKLQLLQNMHEVTWEYQRVGALIGKVLDSDGSTVLLDCFSAFGVTQQTLAFQLTTSTTDVRSLTDQVSDLIDDALGAATYDHLHAFCGATFYDTLIKHKYVQDVLKAQAATGSDKLFSDLRGGFTIGQITFERARRWRVKNPAGAMIDMIDTSTAYAFPVGVVTGDGPMFIGRFAPQPFIDTVNRLNPPLVVKAIIDPGMQFIELIGVSCPLYLNTRPLAVVKLTLS